MSAHVRTRALHVPAVVPIAVALALLLATVAASPPAAGAHGAGSTDYRTTITGIEPAGLPIDVRVSGDDQIRFQNEGDEDLIVCGYVETCEPFAKLGPGGVYENHNSKAYYANLDSQQYGDVPKDVGTGAPDWKLVRREPAFLAYHDHRAHWMNAGTPPPNVDTGDSAAQKVNDFRIDFQYGGTAGHVTGRLDYVGGRSAVERYGEYVLTGGAVLAMLVVFALDARRRRRRGDGGGDGEAGGEPGDDARADGVPVSEDAVATDDAVATEVRA